MKPKVLVYLDRITPTLALVDLCHSLAKDERFNVTIILDFNLPAEVLKQLSGVSYKIGRRYNGTKKGFLDRCISHLPPKFFRLFGRNIISDFFMTYWTVFFSFLRSKTLLKEYDAEVVVLSDERGITNQAGMLRAAKKLHIPVYVSLFATSDLDADFSTRRERKEYHNPSRRYRARFPSEIVEKDGKSVSFHTFGEALALNKLDVLSSNPWVIGFNDAVSKLAVFNKKDKAQFLEMGIASEKIDVTGQVSFDALYRLMNKKDEIRKKLNEKYALNANEPLLICAVPVFGEHNIINEAENKRMLTCLFQILHVLKEEGTEVLLSLHPRMKLENYAFATKDYGLKILEEPLKDVISAASTFTSHQSSVIFWALLMQIPTVILDHYQVNAEAFNNINCCVTVKKEEEIFSTFKAICFDRKERDRLKKLCKIYVENEGVFDGHVCDRIKTSIQELAYQNAK